VAKYYFSSFLDGEAVPFDPESDVFYFDNWFVTPGSVSVLACAASVVLLAENRRVTLTGVTVDQLNPENVHFAGYDLRDRATLLAAAGAD